MRWARRAANLWTPLFHRQQMEEDLDAELRAHFDLLVGRHLARGLTLPEARRAAEKEFEGMEAVKERVREVYPGTAVESVLRDLRFACRELRRSPGFTTIASLTLALGIGLNTAIGSVVHAVLLRPLPYDRPEQLALIWSAFEKMGTVRAPTSGIALREIRQRNRLLQDVAGIWVGNGTFTGGPRPEQVKVASVTPNFLRLLGVPPALGRVFATDDQAGRSSLVLSDGLWRRRFGGDPHIVGKGVSFEGVHATVVGVMPHGFQLHFPPDANVPADVGVFAPLGDDIYRAPVTLYYIRVLARLRPGASIGRAQADLDTVAAAIRGSYRELAAENMKLEIVSLQGDAVRDVRPALTAVFAGAGFLLLICCVNVANLLLARASDRRKEIAVRSALGATRRRIVRQLLLEGLVLCAAAGTAGLGVAWAGTRGLMSIRPDSLARIGEVGVSWPVLGFLAAVSLAVVVLFGLTPSLHLASSILGETLRGAGHDSHTPPRRGVRAALIVAEITFGFVLVMGAGLMIRTLQKIHQVRPGFVPQGLLTFEVDLAHFASPAAALRFVRDWEATVASLPRVESAGAVSHLPLDDYPNWYSPYRPEGVSEHDAASLLADYRCITPGYLRAMGSRLLEGRFFNEQDRADGRQVAIVDELLARSTWPGQSAIGRRIEAEHFEKDGIRPVWSEVVGVVEHIRNHSLAKQLRGEIYVPFEQSPRTHLSFAVRTQAQPLALVATIRDELYRRDKELALSKVRPMTTYMERATESASFTAVLAGVFALLASLLAAIGIYGVVSYSISRRRREMGVRLALGARRGDVVRLVMGEGLLLAAAGMALGLIGALLVSRSLQTLIYGIRALDPATYGLTIMVIAAAALAGCWRPAHRAASANPVDAIRAE